MNSEDANVNDMIHKVWTESSDRNAPRKPPHKPSWTSWITFVFSILFGLGWLAPIFFILAWNFQGHVIGAKVGCPGGFCPINSVFQPYLYSGLVGQYDQDSHSALGALQLVTKALELYFVYVAGSFIWLVMSLMLKSKSGLPTGHLVRHIEFTDPLKLIEKAFWAPLVPHWRKDARPKSARAGLFFFTLLALLITVVTSLMGPATAVLVLPTVKWLDAAQIPAQRFRGFFNDTPAHIFGCSDAAVAAQNYSCTSTRYGSSFDAMAEYLHASLRQGPSDQHVSAYSVEQQLGFAFNVTSNVHDLSSVADQAENYIAWAPNRQVIRELGGDADQFFNMTLGSTAGTEYAPFNSSLQVKLERTGPIIGFRSLLRGVQLSRTIIGNEQEIRCHWGLNVSLQRNLTSSGTCFRTGSGWRNMNYSEAFFNVSDAATNASTPILSASIYYVDSAVSNSFRSRPATFDRNTPEVQHRSPPIPKTPLSQPACPMARSPLPPRP